MTNPRNLTIGFLLVATLGVSVLAWRQYQELIQLRAASLKTDERSDLQKRLWDAEKRARELEGRLAADRDRDPADALAALAPSDDGATRSAKKGDRRDSAGVAAMRALMEKPEMQQLMSLQQKAALDARYAALFKKLNLSPEQIDQVKNLMVERQTARQDVIAVAREQGIDMRTDPTGFRKLMADAQAESDNALKATLGAAGYQELTQYDQTMPQRSVVNQLQQSLSYTSAPLTDAQAEQLIGILASSAPKTTDANRGGGRGGFVGGDMGGGGAAALIGAGAIYGGFNNAPVTTAALTQAQSVLNPAQLQAFQQIQQTQQAQQQVQQLIRDTMTNAGGAAKPKRGKTGN